MPQPNAAERPGAPGSPRARLRLAAVVLLGAVALVWLLVAIRLYFAPPPGPDAFASALLAVLAVVAATAYVVCARLVARQVRWGHLAAIGVAGLGAVLGISAGMSWVDWTVVAANLVALGLLLFTVPRRPG